MDNVSLPKIPAGFNIPRPSIFDCVGYSLNPGQSSTFPILSQLARNYTMFKFEQLVFHYKPLSGELGSVISNSLGKVMMTTNYDPDSFKFTNTRDLENYEATSSGKPSVPILHAVECNPAMRATKELFVQTQPMSDPGPNPGDSTLKDKSFTQVGLFQVATAGISQGANPSSTEDVPPQIIGELWATYRVRFSRILAAPPCGTGTVARYSQIPTGDSTQQWVLPAVLPLIGEQPPTDDMLKAYLEPGYVNPWGQFFIASNTGEAPTGPNRQCLRFQFNEDAPSGTYVILFHALAAGSAMGNSGLDIAKNPLLPGPPTERILYDPVLQDASAGSAVRTQWGSADFSARLAEGLPIFAPARYADSTSTGPIIAPKTGTALSRAEVWWAGEGTTSMTGICPIELHNSTHYVPVVSIFSDLTGRGVGSLSLTVLRLV